MQVIQHQTSISSNYPVSDGEPLAETYNHLYAILVMLEVLRQYLLGRQATVLANQYLYYAQGLPKLRVTPDVMVMFGTELSTGRRLLTPAELSQLLVQEQQRTERLRLQLEALGVKPVEEE